MGSRRAKVLASAVSRAGSINGVEVARALAADGYALVPGWLDPAACAALRERYSDDALFRSTVTMERHGFGRGEYRSFRAPLPDDVRELRETLYSALVPVANRWMERLRRRERFPPTLPLMLDLAAAAGQGRSAALLLRYRAGSGGEFVLVEGRARKQSVAHVAPLRMGDLVVFPNRDRPSPDGGAKCLLHDA